MINTSIKHKTLSTKTPGIATEGFFDYRHHNYIMSFFSPMPMSFFIIMSPFMPKPA